MEEARILNTVTLSRGRSTGSFQSITSVNILVTGLRYHKVACECTPRIQFRDSGSNAAPSRGLDAAPNATARSNFHLLPSTNCAHTIVANMSETTPEQNTAIAASVTNLSKNKVS